MTEISKANQKYLDLLAAVDAEKAVVSEKQTALDEARKVLGTAQSKLSKFEQKHQGETLLKPAKLPKAIVCDTFYYDGPVRFVQTNKTEPLYFNG